MLDETSTRPLVSVIIPFLNAEAFIRESVQSVFDQTYDNWEILFVDDGSADSTIRHVRHWMETLPHKIRLLEHPGHQNRGISASRNLAIRHSRGKYFAPLDADDLWMPEKLEKQVAILETHPEADMVYGRSQRWYPHSMNSQGPELRHVLELGIAADRSYPPQVLSTLLYPLGSAPSAPPSNWLVRRELFEKIGGFEEQFHGMYGLYEDQAFLAKAYIHGTVFVSGEDYWDTYRIHPNSCVSWVTRGGHYRAVRRFFLDWLDTYLERQGTQVPHVREALQTALEVDRRGWVFRVAGPNVARPVFPAENPGVLRITIEKAGSDVRWHVQVSRPQLRIQGGRRYRLTFNARADGNRRVDAGVTLAHEPWNDLGFYQTFEVSPQWNSYAAEFVATANESNARICLDLGGSNVAVEFASVLLVDLPDRTPVEPRSPEVEE